MKNKFKNLKYAAAAFVLALGLSCSNDDDFTPTTPPAFEADQDLSATLTMGDSITLYPKLSQREAATFKWEMNGEVVSTDSIYVYKPDTRGESQITVSAGNDGGVVSLTYDVKTWGAYENGFFTVNEGWFGHGTGTVSFYRYDTEKIEDSIFAKTNPDKDLKPYGSTLEFGTIYNEKLYLVSKAGGPLVVTDAYTLKEEKRIEADKSLSWRAFTGINNDLGVLTSGDGIYKIDLNTLETQGPLAGITGQMGDVVVSGDYIYALSARNGLVIFDVNTFEVVKTIENMSQGITKTADGTVYTAGGTSLVKINPTTLEIENIPLGFTANGVWGAWHPGSMAASADAVFIAKNGPWSGGNEIYRYDGDATSLASPFVSLPETQVIFGSGIGYDLEKEQLVINALDKGWGESYSRNTLYIFDGLTGTQTKAIDFTGYYFPAINVFH
ncbi:DUF5074 domain-containing protein [Formosa haliotis]|uniref:DUF5074 domain-containing protein n=1 Tax=Formosa haliotis TaxID=1555194 RepID=UPI000825F540|nr:DUF5074 domain-containing protein [Formosa haliotis]